MFIFWNIWYWIFRRRIDRELQEMEETFKKWGIWKGSVVLSTQRKARMKQQLKEYMKQAHKK